MSLYETWFKKAYSNDGKINSNLWENFMPKEEEIYKYILKEKVNKLEGTVSELAAKFDISCEYIIGFVDGLNETQNPPLDMQSLTEDTKLSLEINFEVLYKKMVEYKAEHLYNLPEWKSIFTEDELKNLYKGQRSSKTYIREAKIERNEPCPCGSGKKYKKCCGAN